MKWVIDMNVSPDWVPLLAETGDEVMHWSSIGPANAPDREILDWARQHDAVILTQDLDFSQLLFASQIAGPSVVLLRMDNEFDPQARRFLIQAIHHAREALLSGALLTVANGRARLRRLPIGG
jgi:predicted nuclease of predicted toxin-antitoxin system